MVLDRDNRRFVSPNIVRGAYVETLSKIGLVVVPRWKPMAADLKRARGVNTVFKPAFRIYR
jgi:hypothetical protein